MDKEMLKTDNFIKELKKADPNKEDYLAYLIEDIEDPYTRGVVETWTNIIYTEDPQERKEDIIRKFE